MSVEYKRFLDGLMNRKKVSELLGLRVMNDLDFEIAERMGILVPNFSPKMEATGAIISSEQAFLESYRYLELFGLSYMERAKSNVSGAQVLHVLPYIFTYTTHIEYSLDDETNEVKKNSGVVAHFKVPSQFDQVSPLWLAHEHIHSLKETNYEEYQDANVFSDVIPMFFELVMSHQVDSKFTKVLLRNRLALLNNEYSSTKKAKDIFSKDKTLQDYYSIYATSSMQYLNSFYYSLLLFSYYLKDQETILKFVREVLDGKKTTRSMLEELHFIYIYDSKVAGEGIKEIVSRISR